ncbi:dipeptidylpeptidase, partial [Rhizopus stolonifer]
IWLQLLSRDQKQAALVKLVLTSHAIEILWQETNSSWINITDVYYFMQTLSSVHHVKLIWSSERVNGYRHLFLVEKYSHESNSRITQLTQGEWCCVDRPLFVDESRHLVYFSAKMHTPLESHFYVVSYDRPESPRLLTQLGFSHQVSMDSADYFIDCFSALHHPQVILIQKLNHTPISIEKSALLMPVSFKKQEPVYTRPPPSPPPSFRFEDAFLSPETQLLDYALIYNDRVHGEMFSFTTLDGTPLYGCLYKPRYYEPGKSYPTLLHIYGGPKTQLVLNEFKFPRLMRYLMSVYFNFAVVIIDSRGSSDRGLQFESHLQQRLGRVELKDQIEGLEFLHNTQFGAIQQEGEPLRPVIDMNRVAITGWSYGGYLSLMGLAQYPDVFKMAIAGAPVTQWELYDAAYTERYMGLPAENKEDYLHSSVLNYLDQFPNTEHRLLIVHGLIDENVHFRNTEQLVAQLDKLNKPYRLQVYPSEKHGLRHASVNEHFETLMYYWLSNYLVTVEQRARQYDVTLCQCYVESNSSI